MIDLYSILGLEETATLSEIKQAYRKLVKEKHPDHGGDSEAFTNLSNAYAILSNEARRIEYDRTGKVDQESDELLARRIIENKLIEVLRSSGLNLLKEQDIIDRIRKSIFNELEQVKQDIPTLREAVRNIREIKKRLRRKGKKKNYLRLIITGEENQLKQILKQAQRREVLIKLAYDQLAEYIYDIEETTTFLVRDRRFMYWSTS